MKKLFLFLLLFTAFCDFSFAAGIREAKKEVKTGNSLYNEGEYGEALKRYEEAFLAAPDSDIVNYNLGAALYKTKNYKVAMDHFEKTLVTDDKSLEQNSCYNLGNAEYKNGIQKEKQDINEAIRLLERSVSHYERAIAIDPEDKDAKYNHEFVKKELERLRKKEKEIPPPPEEKKDKEDQDKDQEEDQDEGEKEDQGKDQKEEQKEDQEEDQKEEQKEDQKEEKQEKEEKEKEQQKQDQEQDRQQEDQKQEKEEEEKEEEKKKEDEEAQDREQEQKQDQQELEKEKEPQSPRPSGAKPEERPSEMTEKEASNLLENYTGEEEPSGLYRERGPRGWYPEVYKDW